jgi:hypothetical protein
MGAPTAPTFPFATPQVTIASGASLSGSTYLGNGKLVSIQMPSAWTTAVITIQGSYDGVNFYELYNDGGTEYSISAAAGQIIQLESIPNLEGVLYLKLRSGTAASPVNQSVAATITLGIRKRLWPTA